ncbi:MAG: glycosyltransferase [Planctomycetes bacterium]|nr:glycosyltransferase [Planctomycetota bacterium]
MHCLTNTPDASVVVGVYEGLDQLPASMDSVLTQAGPSFEVIVVNDGSGPASSAWLRDLAARDRRVRLIEQDNAGLTAALVRGCGEARAPIIIRQDVGDRSAPGRFQALLEAIHASTAIAMVSSWVRHLGPRGEPLVTVRRGIDPEENRRRLLEHREGPPCHGATAFRRDAFEQAGGYRAKFLYAQDSDLWLRLAELGGFACVQRVLYECTFELEGISATRQALQVAFGEYAHACRAARLAGADDPPPPEVESRPATAEERRHARAAALYYVGACLDARADVRGRGYLRRAIGAQPSRLRTWARWMWSMRPRRWTESIQEGEQVS